MQISSYFYSPGGVRVRDHFIDDFSMQSSSLNLLWWIKDHLHYLEPHLSPWSGFWLYLLIASTAKTLCLWLLAVFVAKMDKAVSPTNKFIVPPNYNYEKSSEANYRNPDAPFVGKYQHIRKQLDYSFHERYGVERQNLQDQLIERFLKTKVVDRTHNLTCEVPLENWIVFTAGPMGAGKGHTIQWLYQTGLFPLDAFVNVDPDAIRSLLPETAQYNALDDKTTGHLTQKEVGYISEVKTLFLPSIFLPIRSNPHQRQLSNRF